MFRILILPGGASPIGSDEYRRAYATIEREAARRNLEINTVVYPGQSGKKSGVITYQGALDVSLQCCREYQPHWLIGRSFGCSVAAGVLGVIEEWVDECRGAVLWGPCLPKTIFRIWPTLADRRLEIQGFEKRGTYLSLDYFNEYPAIDQLIGHSRSSLRLARGSEDRFNNNEELEDLASIHKKMQPKARTQLTIVDGLPHTVTPDNATAEQLSRYFDCLFNVDFD